MNPSLMNLEILELSTQVLIAEARRRNVEVEILDPDDNFIALHREGRTEYVKQATRTSADTYISALLMENKEVTKKVLRAAGLRVPAGGKYHSLAAALAEYGNHRDQKIVVKPNSTNFGEGVAILESGVEPSEYRTALEVAFGLDTSVLVEEFVPGREFRFLVIGGQTRAVLHRMPANVRGDGRMTIRGLVAAKNLHPHRGENYRKPLERIRLDAVELDFLSGQDLTPDSIPDADRVVFLRKNSNISTGGDSIDFTDTMPAVYRQWAEQATAAVRAAICGLDMIIPDIAAEGPDAAYSILELNFNPALHIHDFPAEGKNRHVERHILDLLGFI
jgi:D-alanine-D-alanine ligase-like ATP-grasp enzyme